MGVQQGPGHMVPVVEVVQPSLRDRDGLGRLKPLPGQVHRRRVLRVEEEDPRVVKFAHGTGATRQDGRTVPQRVEDRKAEPFVPRRVDRPTGLLVEAAKPGVGDVPQEPDPAPPGGIRHPLELRARDHPTEFPHPPQLHVGRQQRRLLEPVEQEAGVLPRLDRRDHQADPVRPRDPPAMAMGLHAEARPRRRHDDPLWVQRGEPGRVGFRRVRVRHHDVRGQDVLGQELHEAVPGASVKAQGTTMGQKSCRMLTS